MDFESQKAEEIAFLFGRKFYCLLNFFFWAKKINNLFYIIFEKTI